MEERNHDTIRFIVKALQILRSTLTVSVALCLLPQCVLAQKSKTNVHHAPPTKSTEEAQDGSSHIPILMYHYIQDHVRKDDTMGERLSVSLVNFEKQLQYLERENIHAITFADLKKGDVPSRPIIMTFDDGYLDAYTAALPLLIQYKQRAVFYIVSGFVGKPGYMNWDQIRALQEAGMEIGAHTVDHRNLASLSLQKQKEEIVNSMQTIAKHISSAVISFAYPSGRYTSKTAKMVQNAGIAYAVTTKGGVAQVREKNHWELPRLRIMNATNLCRILHDPCSS